jgi:hypothetical protein
MSINPWRFLNIPVQVVDTSMAESRPLFTLLFQLPLNFEFSRCRPVFLRYGQVPTILRHVPRQ